MNKLPTPTKPSRAPWTLRRRLVVSVVALLALVSLIIGVVSVGMLRASLLQGLDVQLASAADRSGQAVEFRDSDDDDGAGGGNREQPPGFVPSAERILSGPAQQPGTLAVVANNDTITSGYTDETGAIRSLTVSQLQKLASAADTSAPVTVELGRGLGDYRVQTQVTPAGTVYLVGLPLAPLHRTVEQLITIIGTVSLLGLLLIGGLATWIIRLALRPLQRVTETAARVSELPLDHGEVSLIERVPAADADVRTEVGQVGSALNRMLDHVDRALETRQASESKVRQFVADASHELRTPLASIRGYSELTRRSGQTLPPDTVHALSRIESESVRMTGLVEDLLLLARLDEGRELEHDPVDLTRLLVDVVSDAHAAGPDHVWNLDLPDEPIEASGDEARLHQVIANLLANARVHTPEGTVVDVALAVESGQRDESGRAVITVTDNGPGIPDELQSTLFERFARGDSSRFRGTGSTGLGLAIVRAVVTAHRGTVTVESVPGRTCFRVELPLH